MRSRLSSSLWLRWRAMRTSTPTTSSCAAFLSSASTAGALPAWTQTQSGSFMPGSFWICGFRSSSILWRCPSCEITLTSSRTSPVMWAPCSQSAATAAMWRYWIARSSGASTSVVWFTSARALTRDWIAFVTLSSAARLFIAIRLMAVCACATSSSSLPSSENVPSSLLSSPSHSHTRPQTQVIFRQPSLRCVGTPQLGQLCACRAFSIWSLSWHVMPRCHEDILHRKQNRSPQQGVRCRGNRCIHASCTARRLSKSTIHGALPLGPNTLLSLGGGEPRDRLPHECSSRITCRKSSAVASARKNARQALSMRSRISGSNAAKGSRPALAPVKYELVSSHAAHR
mmetsp:Transcript_69661/g.196497  ORF Transcript_69661/g.196497 Transcript_69661/m.196497 type:complete len:343 (-) Transcript_69661:678-1706(-)